MALELPKEKRDKYVQQLMQLRRQNKVWPGDAQKVSGRGEFTTQWCWGHVGRAFMWPIRDKAKESRQNRVSKVLTYALAGMLALYEQARPRRIRELGWHRRRVDLFTDGRGNLDKEWGSEYLGAVCRDSTTVSYSLTPVARADGGFLKVKEHRINKVEALGALFGLTTFQDRIRNADVLLWIDNAAAEGCVNKGYSPDREMAALAGEAWLLADRLVGILWSMRVPSSHNIANPLSR